MRQIDYDEKYKSLRWIGYFDLLGAKELTKTNSYFEIFGVYKRVIEEFNYWNGRLVDINQIWFSDTFILYSEDSSLSGFGELDHIAHWFFRSLIESYIPVRGSIAYGNFYIDRSNNLFFGEPLIEAYEYGEAQDWLGLILCPSAEKKLNRTGIISDTSSVYVYTDVPFREQFLMKEGGPPIKNLPACILGCWLLPDLQKSLRRKLHQMMDKQKKDNHIRKYANTIRFLEQNARYVNL